MDDFVIVTCTHTVELARWGAEYEVWIPMGERRAVRKGKLYVTPVAELPGLAFVGRRRWSEFRRRCPGRFHVKVLEYDMLGRPRTASLAELMQMQAALKTPPAPAVAEPETEELQFEVGEPVGIVGFPGLDGLKGFFVRRKGRDRIRIRLDSPLSPYIDVKNQYVTKITP